MWNGLLWRRSEHATSGPDESAAGRSTAHSTGVTPTTRQAAHPQMVNAQLNGSYPLEFIGKSKTANSPIF